MKKCKICNQDFESNGKQIYCSIECQKTNKNLKRKKTPIITNCLICNTEFSQKRKDNVTCSNGCSQKLWVLNNPTKNWDRNNGADAKIRKQIWLDNNKDLVREIKNRYKKKKYNNDSLFKLKENVRNLIRKSHNNLGIKKNTKTEIILGCSYDDFKNYLESKFEDWMNWDNKGNPDDNVLEINKTWDLDHIIPLDTAVTEDDVIRLNHYSNYQPLCSYHNRIIKKKKQILTFH